MPYVLLKDGRTQYRVSLTHTGAQLEAIRKRIARIEGRRIKEEIWTAQYERAQRDAAYMHWYQTLIAEKHSKNATWRAWFKRYHFGQPHRIREKLADYKSGLISACESN